MESGESAGTVGVRVIAASSRNVEKMAKSGVFREDLYFRLNVLPLYLPPLRTRPEDIAALAALFLKRSDKGRGTVFSAEAQQAMLGYVWPGNARELENRVEMALVTCEGRVGGAIDAKDLFPTDDAEAAERAAEESADLVLPYPAPLPGTELKEAMDDFKKEFITRRLTAHKWNVTRTAGELGMQRTYLSRLLKELGIKKPDSGTEL
jgi:Nif-specific regulatory protein